MKISVSTSDRALINEGPHTLVLISCELKRVPNAFSTTPGATKDSILWKFRNERSQPYDVWTNDKFGYEKAGLTALLQMLVPGITVESVGELDTASLIGCRFRARIVHKVSAGTGKPYARHTFLEPIDEPNVTGPSAAEATLTTTTRRADLTDPFADDEN